jgi:ribosomal protein L12E/L44/L45/RPP1/RPP2
VLATLAQDIMDSGLAALSDDELVGMLRASRRLAAWQNGVELAAVAELDARRMAQAARPRSSRASEHVSEELSAALTMTGRSADLLLGLARDLTRLPMILTALLEGRIDRARAVIFAAELAGLPDLAALAVAMVFAGTAGSMTTGQLRAALRAMVLRVDPAAARRRAERGRADARVEAWQETSGNGALAGRELPAGDAVAADKRITAIARALQHAGAAGSLDQLRAAVFVALLAGRDLESLVPAAAPAADPAPAGAGDEPGADGTPDPGSSRAGFAARPTGPTGPTGLAALTGSVHLTMPVSAWLGLADGPGEVAGLGPLDAWTCRDLAARLTAAGAATRWHVTLTGADGRAVTHACARGSPGQPAPPSPGGGVSRWLAGLTFTRIERGTCIHAREVSGYRPANMVREHVRVRQRTCGFPGCRRPARACDLDHTVPYDQGGRTCECNLAPLCRRHHRAKQAPGWRVDQSEPGILTWTLPHGRSYTAQADVYPV